VLLLGLLLLLLALLPLDHFQRFVRSSVRSA
jgi:hypothetical protein